MFSAHCLLLDIEGTTSSIGFVYDAMFPFVRRELDGYLERQWDGADLAAAREQIARDAGHAAWSAWSGTCMPDLQRQLVRDEVLALMDRDAKATGLKQLQGLIWEAGFRSGELRAHLFDDVAPALRAWRAEGREIRIYSSGSIAAQRLFFGHTIVGDLLPLLGGHYDTTIGGKKEPDSYRRIVADWGVAASDVLFLSDVVAELDAARAAGLQTGLVMRPGNAVAAPGHPHPTISDFAVLGESCGRNTRG